LDKRIDTAELKCEVVKNQIELLDRFYLVIGDDYNPATISMKYSLNNTIKPEEVFVYNSGNNIGKKWFYEQSIMPTKETIENPIGRLTKLMEWNRNHIIEGSGFEKLSQQEFRAEEFKEIYYILIKQVQSIISKWKITSEQYLLDTKDGSYKNVLFIHGLESSIVFEFGNFVH